MEFVEKGSLSTIRLSKDEVMPSFSCKTKGKIDFSFLLKLVRFIRCETECENVRGCILFSSKDILSICSF